MNRAIVEKLPPLRREGVSYRSPFRSKEEGMIDYQQDTFRWLNPHERRHKSATAKQNLYSEGNPGCHRLPLNRNDYPADSDYCTPKDKKTLDWLEVHWGNDKPTNNRRRIKQGRSKVQQFDTDTSGLFRQKDENKRKLITGTLNKSQRILCENEIWMTAEIRKKEILLQEKLLKAAETLKMVQLRNASEEKKREEQKGTGKAENKLYHKKKGNWEWESATDIDLGGRRHEGQQEILNDWKRGGGDRPARQGNHVKGTHAGQKEKEREEKEIRGRQTQRTTECSEDECRRSEEKAVREKAKTEENNIRGGSAMEHQRAVMRKWEQKDRQKETRTANDGGNRRNEETELEGDIEYTMDQPKEIGRANNGGETQHEGTQLKGDIEYTEDQQEKQIGRANDGGKTTHEGDMAQHSNNAEDMKTFPEYNPDQKCLPCKICKRFLVEDRLETHYLVCEKIYHKKYAIFDSKLHRAKGTDLENFMTINGQREEPSSKKSNWREKHKAIQQSRRKAGDYEICPHCNRHFAPDLAQRHIPKCPKIKNKPSTLPHRH